MFSTYLLKQGTIIDTNYELWLNLSSRGHDVVSLISS